MKILAIGDPHGNLNVIKKISLKGIDLILLTGDLGSANLARKMAFEKVERKKLGLPEIEYSPNQKKRAFIEAYKSSLAFVKYLVRYALVYIIFGNVESHNTDIKKESNNLGIALPYLYEKLRKTKGVKVINNVIANFGGVKIGGLEYFIDISWVKEFKPGDYADKLKEARKESEKAKKVLSHFGNVDILLCHQPPYGVLDKVTFKGAPKHWLGKHAGSKVILDYVKKKQPGYVFCGHIHEGAGQAKIGKTKVYNLGICGHKLIEI
jgi:Icc-related predicted phosphoesterase